jgi:hypothetical protein
MGSFRVGGIASVPLVLAYLTLARHVARRPSMASAA